MTSIKEVFKGNKKGSRNYKTILQSNLNVKNKPGETINTNWNIVRIYDKEKFLKKAFTFWKTPYLTSNLQDLHLQIINHKLKLNNQLKCFARDENNLLVSGNCTFCTINNIAGPSKESYKPRVWIKHKGPDTNSQQLQP